MTQDIPDAGYRAPVDLRFAGFQIVGQAAAGFRDDFEVAFDKLAGPPVGAKAVECMACEVIFDIRDGLKDMLGVKPPVRSRQKTCTASLRTRSPIVGAMPSRVTISTSCPSRSERKFFREARSTRLNG